MKVTRILILLLFSVSLAGCLDAKSEERKDDLQIGRYTLHSNSKSIAIYRLDTVTGEILMCAPSGTAEIGYKLVCYP